MAVLQIRLAVQSPPSCPWLTSTPGPGAACTWRSCSKTPRFVGDAAVVALLACTLTSARPPSQAVRCVAFQSARPRRLAMGNNTRCLRLLQPRLHRRSDPAAATLSGDPCVVAAAEGEHRGSVYAVAWREGRNAMPLLATGSNDKHVRVFAVRDSPRPALAHVATGSGVGGTVRAVAFAGEGQLAGAGGGDHAVCLWSLRHLGEGGSDAGEAPVAWSQPHQALTGHSGVVHALRWCSVTRRLFSASKDGTVRVWSPRDSDRPAITLHAPGAATTLAVVPRAGAETPPPLAPTPCLLLTRPLWPWACTRRGRGRR